MPTDEEHSVERMERQIAWRRNHPSRASRQFMPMRWNGADVGYGRVRLGPPSGRLRPGPPPWSKVPSLIPSEYEAQVAKRTGALRCRRMCIECRVSCGKSWNHPSSLHNTDPFGPSRILPYATVNLEIRRYKCGLVQSFHCLNWVCSDQAGCSRGLHQLSVRYSDALIAKNVKEETWRWLHIQHNGHRDCTRAGCNILLPHSI